MEGVGEGVEDESGEAADHRAVDADVLKVRSEEELEAAGRLFAVPTFDGAAHQGGDLAVEVIGDVPDAGFDSLLRLGRQHRVVLEPRPAVRKASARR